jgi:competence ComEA-like helix-hairpin-helix protein
MTEQEEWMEVPEEEYMETLPGAPEPGEVAEGSQVVAGAEEVAEEAAGDVEEIAEVSPAEVSPAEVSPIEPAAAETGPLPETDEGEVEPTEGEEALKIDLNTASVEELQQLPGIGEVLAGRIVSHRDEVQPFREPAEIMDVPGISETIYAVIADRLTVGTAEPALDAELARMEPEVEAQGAELEEAVAPEVEAEAVELEEEAVPELEPEVAEVVAKPPRGPEPPLVEVVEARVGWWRLLLVGVLSAIAGALLVLAFLYTVNGTLDFQGAAVQSVQREAQRLEGELGALGANLQQVEAELQAVAGLEAQLADAQAEIRQVAADLEATQAEAASMAETLGALQQEFTNLREDLDGMAGQVSMQGDRIAGVEERLAALDQDLDDLRQATQRFDAFLGGLRELLDQAEGAMPGESPTRRVEPSSTPEQTPTMRPMVTVIPLATPTDTP